MNIAINQAKNKRSRFFHFPVLLNVTFYVRNMFFFFLLYGQKTKWGHFIVSELTTICQINIHT